jgi:hypothetical protein
MRLALAFLALPLLALCTALPTPADGEPGLPPGWTDGVRLRPVLGDAERHSVHAYFNASPESPDGKRVLLYTSTTAEGYEGELWAVERATGKATVLARNVVVEDTHRAACQQWLSGGERVVFHDRRGGRWVVACVDTDTLKERVLAEVRLAGFGQAGADLVPVYGPHWDPGKHRDLELSRFQKVL